MTFCKDMWPMIKKYGSQQSTWRGLLLIATAFGVHIAPELQNVILGTGLGTLGALDVVKDESQRRTDK
jgi:hypothetical protein